MDEKDIENNKNLSSKKSFSKNARNGSEQSTKATSVLSDHMLTEDIIAHILTLLDAQIIRELVQDDLNLNGSLLGTQQDVVECIENMMLHIGVACEDPKSDYDNKPGSLTKDLFYEKIRRCILIFHLKGFKRI
jgi:hypothetical protein